MLDAITTLQMQELSVYLQTGKAQQRSDEPHAHVYIRAPYGAFATADGYITLAFPPLKKLGEVIGEPAFLDMDDEIDSWARRDEVFARTREKLVERTSAEWLETFRAVDIWCGPIYGYDDLQNDPQILHNGTIVEYDHPTEGRVRTPGFPYRFSKTPPAITRPTPLVGQHSAEILRAVGVDAARIEALAASGAIRLGEDM